VPIASVETPPLAIVRFPADATCPVFVRFEGVEIEAAICTRETYASKLELLPERWSVGGVYVLSAPSESTDFEARVRPGTTQTRPLLERVDEHLVAGESWWRQVILVRRPGREFDNAESGYLERCLHETCRAAARIEHVEGARSSRYKGPSGTDAKADLDQRVLPAITVALRLGGLRLETPQELTELENLRPRRRADEYIDA
jgi:hypothetical protein